MRGVGWGKRQENIKGEMKGVRQKGWEQSRRGRLRRRGKGKGKGRKKVEKGMEGKEGGEAKWK